jgi:hypothetical protein
MRTASDKWIYRNLPGELFELDLIVGGLDNKISCGVLVLIEDNVRIVAPTQ